jgi:hypothetical protein
MVSTAVFVIADYMAEPMREHREAKSQRLVQARLTGLTDSGNGCPPNN